MWLKSIRVFLALYRLNGVEKVAVKPVTNDVFLCKSVFCFDYYQRVHSILGLLDVPGELTLRTETHPTLLICKWIDVAASETLSGRLAG